jgi:hypothetical protein
MTHVFYNADIADIGWEKYKATQGQINLHFCLEIYFI